MINFARYNYTDYVCVNLTSQPYVICKKNAKIWAFKHKSYREYYIAEWIYVSITDQLNLILDKNNIKILWDIIINLKHDNQILIKAFNLTDDIIDSDSLIDTLAYNFKTFTRALTDLFAKKLKDDTISTSELAATIVEQLRILVTIGQRPEIVCIVEL